MTTNHSGSVLLQRMLKRATAALGTGLDAPVSREQMEAALLPAPLKAILAARLGAAAAIEQQSSYDVLRTVARIPPRTRLALIDSQEVRLVAVARNQQLVDSDPLVFVRLGENDVIADEPECFITSREDESWRAESLGYTFDCVLPWRWAAPFVRVVYPFGDEVLSVVWKYSLNELGELLDRSLGLTNGEPFQSGWVTGRVEEQGSWLAVERVRGEYRLCLGGQRTAVRRVQEALDDVALGRSRIKPR